VPESPNPARRRSLSHARQTFGAQLDSPCSSSSALLARWAAQEAAGARLRAARATPHRPTPPSSRARCWTAAIRLSDLVHVPHFWAPGADPTGGDPASRSASARACAPSRSCRQRGENAGPRPLRPEWRHSPILLDPDRQSSPLSVRGAPSNYLIDRGSPRRRRRDAPRAACAVAGGCGQRALPEVDAPAIARAPR